MEISSPVIPVLRSGKLGWYEKFKQDNFLLQESPVKVILIGDSLISNLSRYPDVWKNYFSIHNMLNFGIQGDKIKNILWRLNNLNFSKNCSMKYVFILGGTNVDHNSPEEIANGLITSALSAQTQCQNTKVVIIPLLPRGTKNSLRQENINVINTLLLFKCSKHNLHTFKHQLKWLNIDRSLNMSLFRKDRLHLIKNGNELLAKEILCSYKSLKTKPHNSSIRSFKDVTSLSLNDSEFPPLLSGHSTSNHLMLKKQSDPKTHLLSTNKPLMPTCLYANTHVSTSRAYMLPASTDDVFVHNAKPCIKSSQSFVTVPSVPPVCRTSVHDNVIKKPITCHDPVIKRPRKCLHKSTVVKNRNAVNFVSESVNAVNCSRLFPTSSSGFLRQPVRFNKSAHKHISSTVVNKPTASVDASKTLCAIVKCKTKFYDAWIQFLILFLQVTLSYGYLSFNLGCYYLKANTTVNNLAKCLIFIKYYIYI